MGEDTRLSYFHSSNKVLPSARVVLDFLCKSDEYTPEQQREVLTEVLQCVKAVSTNAYMLSAAKDDSSRTIPEIIISLLPEHAKQPHTFTLLTDLLQLLLTYSAMHEHFLEELTSSITRTYHEGTVLA